MSWCYPTKSENKVWEECAKLSGNYIKVTKRELTVNFLKNFTFAAYVIIGFFVLIQDALPTKG